MLFDFDHLMHECFDDADAHVVIIRLLFVIDRYQIQMYADQHSFDVQFVDHFLENFTQLKQAFDDKTWELRLVSLVLIFSEQVEKNTEDTSLVTVLETSKHGSVQVFKDKFSFLVCTKFVQSIDKKTCQQLLCHIINLLLSDLFHDLFARAALVDDCHEVLSKSEWEIFYRSFEYVYQNVGESADQIVCSMLHCFLVSSNCLNYFV